MWPGMRPACDQSVTYTWSGCTSSVTTAVACWRIGPSSPASLGSRSATWTTWRFGRTISVPIPSGPRQWSTIQPVVSWIVPPGMPFAAVMSQTQESFMSRAAREHLAQLGLAELPDARLRDLVDELEPLGQPPRREARREELAEFLARRRLALAQHDRCERPLGPLLVGDRDHSRLRHGRMGHERVLELDGRDPLAARLDHVLRAILDLDEAPRADGNDVAGPEPAVRRPAVRALGRVEVGRSDPRAAHLELAHRLVVHGTSASSARTRISTNGSGMPAVDW